MLKKIFPVVLLTFINTLGFSILIPVLPFIVEQYQANDIVFGLLLSAYSAFQFIGSPLLGQLSDSYGRRSILLISQAGTLGAWIIFASAWYADQMWQLGFWTLFIIGFARIFDGITGGNNSVANAYLSDITESKDRAQSFGIIGATTGLGLIIGPAVGAFTSSSEVGYLGTAVFSTILSALTLLAIWRYLPESLPENKRSKTHLSLAKRLHIMQRIRQYKHQPIVITALRTHFIFSLAMAAYTSTIVLLVIDIFGFDEQGLGFFLLFVGSFSIFNQSVLVKPFTKIFGDIKTIYIGLLSLAIGLIAFPSMEYLIPFVLFYYFANLGVSLCIPTIKSVLSKNTPNTQQGDILGIHEGIWSLGMAIMPAIAAATYQFIGGWSFRIWAILALVGAFTLIQSTKNTPTD